MNGVSERKLGYQVHEPDPLKRQVTRILKGRCPFEVRFVPNHTELAQLLSMFREMGCCIAFTTGVWDLFHIGHAEYIQLGRDKAAALYPKAEHVIMIVGVDTDELTKQRKGPDRPIVPMDERCRVLSHLRAVDLIVPQYEEGQLHQLVMPDVRIISESTKDLPGLEEMKRFCGELVNLPPQAETSTTSRVRHLALDGAKGLREEVMQTIDKFFGGAKR